MGKKTKKKGGGGGGEGDAKSDNKERTLMDSSETITQDGSKIEDEQVNMKNEDTPNGDQTQEDDSTLGSEVGDTITIDGLAQKETILEASGQEQEQQPNKDQDTTNLHTRIKELESQLAEAIEARETAQDEYESLLERISNIKATLGARLKSDIEKINALEGRVEELQQDKATLRASLETTQKELTAATSDYEQVTKLLSELREETTISNEEWARERESLMADRKRCIDRLEASESARRDLEIALDDERVGKSGFTERVSGLQDQINTQTQYAERFRLERDSAQNALKDTEIAYEKKLKEALDRAADMERSNDNLQRQYEAQTSKSQLIKSRLEESQARVAQLEHFEEEIKEKNLIVGKLRHEAVILNEHLVKALRMIKKDSEGDTVDKQLISNLLISFLSFPRGDTKKFETLQLIANCLGWDEDQKVQAGLSRSAMGPAFVPPKRSESSSSLASQGDSSANNSGRFIGRLAEFFERDNSK